MIFIFFSELVLLFLLSRSVSRELSFLFFKVTKSRKLSVFLLAVLYLPGTIIHEFSHAICAEILFVRARHMELFPEIEGNNVRLGSVQIQQTDFIRRFFIGIAPFVIGTLILTSLVWTVTQSSNSIWILILVGYALFTVSNTMFSSKKDMEGAIEFIILAVLISICTYFLGFQVNPFISQLDPLIKQSSIFLAFPIIIDLIVVSVSKLVTRKT